MLQALGHGSCGSVLGANGKIQAIWFSRSQQSGHHKLMRGKGTNEGQLNAEKGKAEY